MTTIPKAEVSTIACGCQQRHQQSCLEAKLKQRKLAFEATLQLLLEAVCKVMYICGIPRWKTIAASDAIVRAFTDYDEICYRVDRMPYKRLCKEDLVHDLAVKAKMSRTEAQIGYSIVRRVFKAHYYGTGVQGQPITSSSMRHRAECVWRHAAERTAQIFASYAGLMHSEQTEYEERFKCIYKYVHDTLQSNAIDDDEIVCTCQPRMSDDRRRKRSWRSVSLVQDVTESLSHLEILYRSSGLRFTTTVSKISIATRGFNMTTQQSSSTLASAAVSAENIPRYVEAPCGGLNSDDSADTGEEEIVAVVEEQAAEEQLEEADDKVAAKCNCPPLVCARAYDTQPPQITAECSQGPFICRWLPISEEEEEEPRVLPCIESTVPVCRPCKSHSSSTCTPCDSECSCICEWCECNSHAMQMEEAEQQPHMRHMTSNEGIEDNDTDFTYVAPLRDRPPSSSSAIDMEELEAEQETCAADDVECSDICKRKMNLTKPEDVNYVAPLKTHPTSVDDDDEEEEGAEASERSMKPAKPIIIVNVPGSRAKPPAPTPKPPPPGISWQTAMCWRALKPQTPSNEEEAMSEELARVRRKCRPTTAASQTLQLSHIKLLSSPPLTSAAAASPMPIVTVKTRHGSSTAAAPTSRYAEAAATPKAAQHAASVAAAKPPTNANQTPPIANNKTPTTAKKPTTTPTSAAPPAPAKRASAASARRSAANEPPLTKEDIMNIIGI